jgi:hypothetical protein
VRLVRHQEIQPRSRERFDILLACEEQFKLLDVGQ